MRIIILLLFLFVNGESQAQQRWSFTAMAGANYTSAKTVENTFTTVQHGLLNRVADTFYLQKNYLHYNLTSDYKGRQGASFGLLANFQLNKQVAFSGGLGLATFGFTRRNRLVNTSVSDPIYLTVIYQVPSGAQIFTIPGLETSVYNKYAGYYFQVSEEIIDVTALKIPLQAALGLFKSKFNIRLGLVPVILLNYRVTPNEKIDFEGFPLKVNQTENKVNLTASVGLGFPIYKSLTGNIYYEHYFRTITEGQMVPALTPQILNLSLNYKLPKIKLHG